MKTITITDEAYRAMVVVAMPQFRRTGIRQSDGSWEVPVDDATWRALQAQRFRNESDSAVLQRIKRRSLDPSTHWLPWPIERLKDD